MKPNIYSRKKKNYIIFFFVSFITFLNLNATTYYVKSDGSNSNNGLTEATAWKTIKYAAGKVTNGDIVYVKAGIYNDKNLKLPSGITDSKITFEGYQNTPGDISNIDWWDYETNRNLDPTKMPLLNGGDRATGTGINFTNHIVVKNFQVTMYSDGVISWSAEDCIIENIIVSEIGDINDSYDGTGIGIYYGEGFNTIKNCVVYNAAAEAVMVYKDDHNLLENVKVYCDDNQTLYYSNTDYYFEIESNDNIIRNCYIERVGNLDHVGHGFTMKGDGYEWSGNLFENCVAKNLEGGGFVARHSGVTNNVYKNCTAYKATGFLIRDGANHNKYYNCKAIDCTSAVSIMYTGEDPWDPDYAGTDNDFYNCLFKNFGYFINFNSYDGQYSKGGENNRFINCVIENGQVLYRCNRENKNNELINSIVSNVSTYRIGNYDISMSYTNSDFWNNEFDTPSGSNILAIDPLFSDAAHGDYSLQANSPCIDAGVTDTSGLFLPLFDADGNSRISDGNGDAVATIDIGAFEYIGSAGSNILPIANAGADQTVVDNDENGSEDISLDGSASSDSDGTIVSYLWKEGETQIATGVTPTVNLSVATHTITLTVTDNKGGAKSDNVIITVQAKADTVNPGNFALRFNSETKKDDFLLIENIPTSSIYTIEFWVKLENSTNDTDALIWMGGDGQRLTLRNNHKPTWGESLSAMAANGITLNEWHHIAYVANNDKLKSIFIDGVSQTIEGGTDVIMPGNTWSLASYYGSDESQLNFVGAMDELRIWNVVRTSQEINDNKDKELTGSEEGLVAYWNFNDGTGNVLSDAKGQLNGTLYNMENTDWIEGVPLNSVGVEHVKNIPSEIYLSQNYPNPFNPTTNIQFMLPVASNVKLIILNTLGQIVDELVNEKLNSGVHEVTWSAHNVTSGIYFYMIETNSFTQTRKMILLR